jgi:hypothetical protein
MLYPKLFAEPIALPEFEFVSTANKIFLTKRPGKLSSWWMNTVVKSADLTKSQRSAEHSSSDFVQAVRDFAGLVEVYYRTSDVQRFSISALPILPFPVLP